MSGVGQNACMFPYGCVYGIPGDATRCCCYVYSIEQKPVLPTLMGGGGLKFFSFSAANGAAACSIQSWGGNIFANILQHKDFCDKRDSTVFVRFFKIIKFRLKNIFFLPFTTLALISSAPSVILFRMDFCGGPAAHRVISALKDSRFLSALACSYNYFQLCIILRNVWLPKEAKKKSSKWRQSPVYSFIDLK